MAASVVVQATAAAVFDFVRRPANPGVINGDDTVRGVRTGPEVLGDGDAFGMRMKLFGVPYAITSKVVELDEGRRIAWCHAGGHRWRWEIEPVGADAVRVTETFDMTTSRFPAGLRLVGYPKRHVDNVTRSVANLAAHFGSPSV